MDEEKLLADSTEVLKLNDRGNWTVPSAKLYPHQWLWDSCFIAIGLRHIDVESAQTELTSLLRGQWSNSMLPHIIFSDNKRRMRQGLLEGWLNPHAPDGIITSGLTQPPMLAEAVWQVGQELKLPERRSWFNKMLPHLVAHHQWLYAERDGGQGLAIIIHPYESGLDNTPSSISEVHRFAWPWWLKVVEALRIDSLGNLIRTDVKALGTNQRMSNAEAIAYTSLVARLRRRGFDIRKISKRPHFAVVDLGFNCVLIKANEHLTNIAKTVGRPLPDKLRSNIERSKTALDTLWDEQSGYYLSRSLISGQLIDEPSIASLLPLYAGSISEERATRLVELLKKRRGFGANWPVPSVPLSSDYFNPNKYWQGPTWVNTNWLIIKGLEQNGFKDEAEALTRRTLQMVSQSGIFDYYNPLSGKAVGTDNFSWTAALTIDLLKSL